MSESHVNSHPGLSDGGTRGLPGGRPRAVPTPRPRGRGARARGSSGAPSDRPMPRPASQTAPSRIAILGGDIEDFSEADGQSRCPASVLLIPAFARDDLAQQLQVLIQHDSKLHAALSHDDRVPGPAAEGIGFDSNDRVAGNVPSTEQRRRNRRRPQKNRRVQRA